MLWNSLLIALRQLSRNKARTALTSLGILIGVAAVISMLSIGRGATLSVEEDLASIGQNLLFVSPSAGHGPPTGATKPFTEGDVEAIATQIGGLDAVAPVGSSSVIAVNGEESRRTAVTGSTVDYLRAMRWEVATGRIFESGEALSGAEVCLLGRTVQEELFGAQDPLDQELRLGDLTCRVVGTLAPKGENTFGQDQDDFVLVPLRTFQRRIAGSRDIGVVFLSASEGADIDRVKSDVEALLTERRHIREGSEPDFVVRDMREMSSMVDSITTVLTGFLAAIAGVSLLVGGIGIMNIMLVSVTERTREIGIRLAIGALARDVLLQFLVEAVVLSGIGGLLGIGFGALVSLGAAKAIDIPMVVDPPVIALAVAFSAAIGVIFGYFPARRAARMNPIDALRHE